MPYKDYEKQKENARKNYYKNKEKRLKQAKEYYYKNWEECQIRRNKWKELNPEKYKESKRKWFEKWKKTDKYKIQCKAYYKFRWALKTGKLIKNNKCELCGKLGKTEGHHYKGYDIENALEVQWLCPKCHRNKDLYVRKNSRIN